MARKATPLTTAVSEAPRTVKQRDLTSTENSAQQTPQQQAPTSQQNTQARLIDPAPTATPAQPTEGVGLSGSAPSTSPPISATTNSAQPIGLDRASQKPSSVAQLSPSSGLVLEVEALDSTWLYIRWDDKRTFRGIVPRGERRRFEADDHFLVLSGRAHGLHYRLNDKLLGNGQLGEATKVLRFRANSEGIEFLGPNFAPLTSDAATEHP
jgi:hypothetical protein